jgi:hypothetical protein
MLGGNRRREAARLVQQQQQEMQWQPWQPWQQRQRQRQQEAQEAQEEPEPQHERRQPWYQQPWYQQLQQPQYQPQAQQTQYQPAQPGGEHPQLTPSQFAAAEARLAQIEAEIAKRVSKRTAVADDTCSVCSGPRTHMCSCRLAESKCAQGHEWYFCSDHHRRVEGKRNRDRPCGDHTGK